MRSLSASLILDPLPRLLDRRDRSVPHLNLWRLTMKKLILTATLILLGTLSHAQVPNTFSSGETISSSQINANFSFLADAMARGNITAMMACSEMGVSDIST